MDKAKTVTVTFSTADKVRIFSKPYNTLTSAFTESISGQIQARAIEFVETLNVTLPTNFRGGFDAEFNSNSGSHTILKGKLTIGADGSLFVEGLVIR